MIDPINTKDTLDTTLMGPGFFMFFQRNIIESGGYKERQEIPDVYKYRPRVRYKFADEEEREVAEVVEAVFESAEKDDTQTDLELVLRLKLKAHHIRFKTLYMRWLEQEYSLFVKWKREQDAIFLLLLH